MKTKLAPFVVSKLARPIHAGDWHDRPLRWQVDGLPEVQQFAAKADAVSWGRIRRKCASFEEAFGRSMNRSGLWA